MSQKSLTKNQSLISQLQSSCLPDLLSFKTNCLTQRTCSISQYAGWAIDNLPSYYTHECLIFITQRYVILWEEGKQTEAMSVCFLMHSSLQARLIIGIKLGTSLLLRGIRSKDNKAKTILLNGVQGKVRTIVMTLWKLNTGVQESLLRIVIYSYKCEQSEGFHVKLRKTQWELTQTLCPT